MDKNELSKMQVSGNALREMVKVVREYPDEDVPVLKQGKMEKQKKTPNRLDADTIAFQANLMTELQDSCIERLKDKRLSTLDVIGVLRLVEFKFLNDLNKMFDEELTQSGKTPKNKMDYLG